MQRNNNEYLVYGINNAISLLTSKKYVINSIVIIKEGLAGKHPLISKFISDNNFDPSLHKGEKEIF